MKHQIDEAVLERYQKRVEITSACIFFAVAALLYLITDSFWGASIIPLYPLAAKIFWDALTVYLDDVDEWRDWEIERTPKGLRFHYKNTGSNVLFSDLSKVKIDSKYGEIAGLTLTLKNGQRIGVSWYNDMNALYQHLLSGVGAEVEIIC
ncbi:hypothetical protein [uncultured Alcanivorax sp.]|jgi:hypothetical protein|uniref:hypothetical protein n=1 Tax=uncultured Alcanivorax sp. TaxID=191215 RepID=UPI00261DE895|nr:hypothetical protein [uncultured Alcanivorax sp.]